MGHSIGLKIGLEFMKSVRYYDCNRQKNDKQLDELDIDEATPTEVTADADAQPSLGVTTDEGSSEPAPPLNVANNVDVSINSDIELEQPRGNSTPPASEEIDAYLVETGQILSRNSAADLPDSCLEPFVYFSLIYLG